MKRRPTPVSRLGGKYAHIQFADTTPDQTLSIDTEVDLVIVALGIS